jgi:hypothetical protein
MTAAKTPENDYNAYFNALTTKYAASSVAKAMPWKVKSEN